MATNIHRTDYPVRAALPITSLASGDVGVLPGDGYLPYIALEATGARITGKTTLALANIVLTAMLTVVGENDSGNVAVTYGDKLYLDGAAVNRDSANGTFIGYSLGVVVSGASTSIEVAMAAAGS